MSPILPVQYYPFPRRSIRRVSGPVRYGRRGSAGAGYKGKLC
ncbi:MAG: hypothetical protein AVDCRST_MAG05-2124 [uncultured Rubrobacteraceae bacterium]|uniref:Uncharacterized protein n=1 Tax=uncultured Rubrobacteraceae bacterium TaxID=349277 RepID=A0A6J4SCF9_9ACTN|nr:MAG: hypothetical protein AVDCRST_MAG05-2124 [uncultured Rubrobacteraceae bacterium]